MKDLVKVAFLIFLGIGQLLAVWSDYQHSGGQAIILLTHLPAVPVNVLILAAIINSRS